jgi:hypothetical protein
VTCPAGSKPETITVKLASGGSQTIVACIPA